MMELVIDYDAVLKGEEVDLGGSADVTQERIIAHINRLENDPEFARCDEAILAALSSAQPPKQLSPVEYRAILGIT